ncbi:MAG: histidinol-phosphate transaminase [Candidatus Omnitrophica bacterium]|nr:histidinol-phosphate transaminase [Candidatus Omnitrophota bacterium]
MKQPAYKSHIEAIQCYEPGKPIEEVQRELGLRNVIKLASNENPLGPSKKVIAAIQKAGRSVHLYPDGGMFRLKKALAKYHEVKPSEIIVGNGSNEIIELLVHGFIEPGDAVVSSDLTFLVYPLATQAAGGKYIHLPMKNFRYDLRALAKAVSVKTRLVFIANPNNPTGSYVSQEELDRFIDSTPPNVIICLDEAYVDFTDAKDFPRSLDYIKKKRRQNVVLLRTFSKSFGLAGLRLGYGLANETLIGYLHKIRQPFNVNSVAQAAGEAALADTAYLSQTRNIVLQGRNFLESQFRGLGLYYVPSQANFVLVCVKKNAREIFQKLLKRGVIVRDMRAYGLNEWIRVTVGKPAENRLFVRELKKIL